MGNRGFWSTAFPRRRAGGGRPGRAGSEGSHGKVRVMEEGGGMQVNAARSSKVVASTCSLGTERKLSVRNGVCSYMRAKSLRWSDSLL